MCRKDSKYVTRLGYDSWVEIYTPLPTRQGFIGDADATSEIHQATAKWREFEDFSWIDPEKPWRQKDEHS